MRDRADVYFTMGASHQVCEDYALSGRGPGGAFVVVSDGCSSAPQTDVGARLLAHAAAQQLRTTSALSLDALIVRAAAVARHLTLAAGALDATLLAAWRVGSRVEIAVAGDGVVVALPRAPEEAPVGWRVEDEDQAPGYPAYTGDRFDAYCARYGRRRVSLSRQGVEVSRWRQPIRERKDLCLRWSLPVAAVSGLLIASDGVASFRRDDEPVEPMAIAAELTAFRTTTGAFLQRRARRFLGRTCPTLGYAHHDDIALGALLPEAA